MATHKETRRQEAHPKAAAQAEAPEAATPEEIHQEEATHPVAETREETHPAEGAAAQETQRSSKTRQIHQTGDG